MIGFTKMALTCAAGLTVLAAGAPVLAAPSGEVVQVFVGHADLNLAQDKDVATLDRRLRQAARQICGVNMNDVARRTTGVQCTSRALATAAESRRVAIAAAASGTRTAMASPITMRAR